MTWLRNYFIFRDGLRGGGWGNLLGLGLGGGGGGRWGVVDF